MLHDSQTIAAAVGCCPMRVYAAVRSRRIPAPDAGHPRQFLWKRETGERIVEFLKAHPSFSSRGFRNARMPV
jgi:hypothetical protein